MAEGLSDVLEKYLAEVRAELARMDGLYAKCVSDRRARLAARDAEWRAAVKGSVREFHCEPDEEPCCADCAPLRGLMAAAEK